MCKLNEIRTETKKFGAVLIALPLHKPPTPSTVSPDRVDHQ